MQFCKNYRVFLRVMSIEIELQLVIHLTRGYTEQGFASYEVFYNFYIKISFLVYYPSDSSTFIPFSPVVFEEIRV